MRLVCKDNNNLAFEHKDSIETEVSAEVIVGHLFMLILTCNYVNILVYKLEELLHKVENR